MDRRLGKGRQSVHVHAVELYVDSYNMPKCAYVELLKELDEAPMNDVRSVSELKSVLAVLAHTGTSLLKYIGLFVSQVRSRPAS